MFFLYYFIPFLAAPTSAALPLAPVATHSAASAAQQAGPVLQDDGHAGTSGGSTGSGHN